MAGQPNDSLWDTWDAWNTSDCWNASEMYEYVYRSKPYDPTNWESWYNTSYPLIVYTVVMGTLIVVGVIGNGLAYVVFWKDNIKTSASFFFQSLALVDTALLLTAFAYLSVPSFLCHIGWLYCPWAIGFVYVRPLLLVTLTASIYVTVLFAVNRYIAVCFPLKSLSWCNISNVKKELAIVLLFSVMINIPRFAEYRIEYIADYNFSTVLVHLRPFAMDNLYDIVYSLAFYHTVNLALPLAILSVLNIRLIKALKTSRRNRMEMLSRRQHHDNNATLLLIIVIGVFIIFQVPSLICEIYWTVEVRTLYEYALMHYMLWPISKLLIVLNSSVNFVIYVVFNKRFRHVLTKTVCRSACWKSTGDGGARRRHDVPVGRLEMRHDQPRE